MSGGGAGCKGGTASGTRTPQQQQPGNREVEDLMAEVWLYPQEESDASSCT